MQSETILSLLSPMTDVDETRVYSKARIVARKFEDTEGVSVYSNSDFHYVRGLFDSDMLKLHKSLKEFDSTLESNPEIKEEFSGLTGTVTLRIKMDDAPYKPNIYKVRIIVNSSIKEKGSEEYNPDNTQTIEYKLYNFTASEISELKKNVKDINGMYNYFIVLK